VSDTRRLCVRHDPAGESGERRHER
jgi:hypothetical protein